MGQKFLSGISTLAVQWFRLWGHIIVWNINFEPANCHTLWWSWCFNILEICFDHKLILSHMIYQLVNCFHQHFGACALYHVRNYIHIPWSERLCYSFQVLCWASMWIWWCYLYESLCYLSTYVGCNWIWYRKQWRECIKSLSSCASAIGLLCKLFLHFIIVNHAVA